MKVYMVYELDDVDGFPIPIAAYSDLAIAREKSDAPNMNYYPLELDP